MGRVRVLVPAAVGLLGVGLALLNLVALRADVVARLDGARVTFHIDRCIANGRSRACTGSYAMGGRRYAGRLLLGGGDERLGETVPALVRHAGDDASGTGLAAPIEAAAISACGVAIAVIAFVRAARARGAPVAPPRPWRERARVWEEPGEDHAP